MTLQAFIDRYITATELSGHLGEVGCQVHRGLVRSLADLLIPKDFTEQVKYQEGGRHVWINCIDLSVIHYCEGDVVVTVHQSFASLKQEIFRMDSLYLYQ